MRAARVVALLIALALTVPGAAQTRADADNAAGIGERLDRLEDLARQQLEAQALVTRRQAQARASARRAAEAIRAAQTEAARSNSARVAAERTAAQAKATAERDRRAAEIAARRQREIAVQLKRLRQDASRVREASRRTLMIAAAAGAVVFLLVLGVALALRARGRRRAAAEVEALRRERPDPVADGLLRSARLNLQLPGLKLPDAAGGVIVGRNPEVATAVINRNDVSRRHARFFHRDGAYWVEDLDSLEGTWVNGARLQPHAPVRLEAGARVTFAEYEFSFDVAF